MQLKSTLISVVPVLLVVVIVTYSYMSLAWELYKVEVERGGKGYVTDEVWYVSAARNILRRVFGVQPRQASGVPGVTVVFSTSECSVKWVWVKSKLVELASKHGLSANADYGCSTSDKKLCAVYVSGPSVDIDSFVNEAKSYCIVVDVVPGWMLPDADGIHEYINWEHPPLGKYAILLSMYALGDDPRYWRIPVIIAGVITAILVYFTLLRLSSRLEVALIGALLAALDPMSRALFSISILDGYVALFAVLSMYLSVRRKYREALLVAVIGGLFKATGLFTAIPVILLASRDAAIKANRSTVVFVKSVVIYSIVVIALYFTLLPLVSIPIIRYMGINDWVQYALIGAIRWHLSVKCTGPQCPVASAPWEWFVGLNSFTLYVYPDGRGLFAEGLYPLWLASLLLLVVYAPLVFKGLKEYGYVVVYYVGVLVGYIAIWLLGSKTQYSFYGVHLAPFIYMNLVYILYISFTRVEVPWSAVTTWKTLLEKALKLLLV